MEKKIGAYICTGCGIGDALDVAALAKVATGEYKVPVCREHGFLCSEEGRALIQADVEQEGVNSLVIAACSPRVMVDAFDFGPDKVVERVNLREQVVWSHPAEDEDTQMMAEDYLRMGITKAKEMEPPVPYQGENLSKRILVVGGGLTGLTAAKEAAAAGYEVVLVEKSDELGGYTRNVAKLPPLTPPYEEPTAFDLEGLVGEVTGSDKITVYTGSQIEKISGAPCMFDVSIQQNGSQAAERVGAIVLATGAVPYDASKLEHLGFGKHPDVITADQLEGMFKAGEVKRPSNGQPVNGVAFILCAGSRDPEHLPYCSAACCVESLKQAKYFKDANPEMPVYIFYKDLRAHGTYEFLYKQLQKDGVFFVRGTVTGVDDDGSGALAISAEDVLTRAPILSESVDLVVLATGMVSTASLGKPYKAQEPKEGEEEVEVPADTILASNLLNLEYRQGPEIPALKYGFPDSHFICFPYESRRTGIYPAGTVRAPMDYSRAMDDAAGAALKAIQCVEMTGQGKAVHPRAGDLSYPEFFMQRCTQCKRCTEECPFGAINEDEKANPLPNPTRCRRCGVCMGACPERIISFKNYSVGMIGNMIKNIEVPEEDEEKPRILVLACENDAYPALDMVGIRRAQYNPWVRVIPVRCLGSMNLVWIADALSSGIDGILLLGCKHGDDYQCHFVKGSELANIRMSKIKETLDRLVLESERVRFEQLSITDYGKLPEILDDFASDLEDLGPNPYKDF
ncbi:putative adenylylsulfate reductase-associated electron transfer protein QmoB [Desulfacinum hydrothermale DSM 13146]|uniref:Putative adenylylsulfate reductase-associated electron transfer protein QmoB n=1 Tax=Desulfacinum hydrothermale DSM 13146 TaxID=1121390 RepID=A0A1W1XL64_9BACT|nr:FAD-dependent oxidoreductase [Desulfacinum hydrothermale]SMC24557.1 putative adenylylsulfate reductase-associated electron transfer protein QmoB [Desulfacinum hydrothermale DSM 13146]